MAVLAGRRVFRVCRARYARLDGTGARRVGDRWNSPGRAVVYMAESIALAVLENLVHMTRQDFPRGYVCVAAVLPDGIRDHGCCQQEWIETNGCILAERRNSKKRIPAQEAQAKLLNFNEGERKKGK